MNLLDRYYADLVKNHFKRDASQEKTIAQLQRLYDDLIASRSESTGLLSWFNRKSPSEPTRGAYLWGGVGRGKTYLMDLFFDCLPFKEKKRTHFHRFMKKSHEQLKSLRDRPDPLSIIGENFAESSRVLCFDEFIVNDIGDAMILGGLLKHLLARRVVLVATSNIHPDELYKNGLQRDRFQPAIDLIKAHTMVIELDGGADYRLQFLDRANTYFCPIDRTSEDGLRHNFTHLASEPGRAGITLEIEGRNIRTVRHATGVVWFDFMELCGGPRSQNDYLEIARCFHTVLVSNIPRLDADSEDKARRLVNLIDIMYDHNVKFIASAEAEPDDLYHGARMQHEFARTASRLVEMQSHDYLAKKHVA